MKRFVASVGMVLAALSVAAAQMAIYPGRQAGPADVMGGTIGDLVGSTVGDSYGNYIEKFQKRCVHLSMEVISLGDRKITQCQLQAQRA